MQELAQSVTAAVHVMLYDVRFKLQAHLVIMRAFLEAPLEDL